MAKQGKSIIRRLIDFNKNMDKLVGGKKSPPAKPPAKKKGK